MDIRFPEDGRDIPTATRGAGIARLFNPRSVAVIGASDDYARIGGRPISYMIERGFAGTILPVNPNRATVQGLAAYASVADLPETPDLAIIAVPQEAAVQAVEALAARGTSVAILFTAGFAEVDEAGRRAQDRMVAAARDRGMRLLGPNCLGMFNTSTGFYGTFSAVLEMGFPKRGSIGIASQSGAYGTHLVCAAREMGLGIAAAVMTGNEADITIGEVIGEMVENPEIEVIAVYSEGLSEAGTLLRALEAARAARKPVVMMKVGRSALGAAAAQSHTASIAGDDAVVDAVLAEFGVARARTSEEMLDIAALATRRVYPVANSLGVFTISGGAGVLISDAADAVGLPMPEMPAPAQERLKAILPYATPRNPVDCTAQFLKDMSLVGQFAEALVEEGGYSSILGFLSYTGAVPSIAARLREQLNGVRAKHPDRLYVLSLLTPPEIRAQYESDGFTVFADPSRAVTAIDAMGRFGASFAAPPRAAPPEVPAIALPALAPSEAEAKRLLSRAGIDCAPEAVCTTADEAVVAAEELGLPVVMKILSPDIVHKSEIGGVLVGVTDTGAVRAGFATLIERAERGAPRARIEGVLVARQLTGGVECIMGIHRDPVFGPVAMFGLGGIFVEILKDTVLRRCPFGEDVAEEMIRSIRGAPLLLGARGRPPADIAALARMLSRLSVFAHQAGPQLAAIDLNPVFAMPAGEGAFAADAVIELNGRFD